MGKESYNTKKKTDENEKQALNFKKKNPHHPHFITI